RALLIRQLLDRVQRLLRGLQVLVFRALELLFAAAELLVLLQVIVIGLDDDLRQFAGLAAGGAAEGRPIGEGDCLRRWRRRRRLGGLLHRELLGLPGTASQKYCNDKTQELTHFGVHAPFLSSRSRELLLIRCVLFSCPPLGEKIPS